jgi:hypothetical protein
MKVIQPWARKSPGGLPRVMPAPAHWATSTSTSLASSGTATAAATSAAAVPARRHQGNPIDTILSIARLVPRGQEGKDLTNQYR